MYPLSVLKAAINLPMLIELKNGETYNGVMVECNNFMNMRLKSVICTSKDGDRFFKIPEVSIFGNSIKYIRIQDEVMNRLAQQGSGNRSQRGRPAVRRAGFGRGRHAPRQ